MDGTFRPGDRCDRYQVVRLLAQGGMGEVYEALHTFTRRRVALKTMQIRHQTRADVVERMRLEAIVLSEIRHPNIVTVFDAGITDTSTVWIAMELLEGKTVRDLVATIGALPVPQALLLAAEIADGVAAAHALDVVHRDLKPENVFVTRDEEVKVLDLGAAKFYGHGARITDRLRTLGTPAYMSPEHVRGEKVDARTDVYALGMMLWEMLVGRHPFASDKGLVDSERIGRAQLDETPPRLDAVLPWMPAPVCDLVERALAKDREARVPTMEAFVGELRWARQWAIDHVPASVLGGAAAIVGNAAAGDAAAPSIAGAPTSLAVPIQRRSSVPPAPGSSAPPAPRTLVSAEPNASLASLVEASAEVSAQQQPVAPRGTLRMPSAATDAAATAETSRIEVPFGGGARASQPTQRMASDAAPVVATAPMSVAPPLASTPRPAMPARTFAIAFAAAVLLALLAGAAILLALPPR